MAAHWEISISSKERRQLSSDFEASSKAAHFALAPTMFDRAYDLAAQRMEELARTIPGYLGIESVRAADGEGITVSYWADEDAIARWRDHPEHLEVQAQGRRSWYDRYELRVGRVGRARSFPAP